MVKSRWKRSLLMLMLTFAGITGLYASDGTVIDTGATAWMLTSTALVLLMVPGLAMFYGGLGTFKKRSGYDYAQFCCNGYHKCVMGDSGIQYVFWW